MFVDDDVNVKVKESWPPRETDFTTRRETLAEDNNTRKYVNEEQIQFRVV